MAENVNELTADQLAAMMEGLQKGLTLADVTSLTPEYVESLYALAYNLYTSSNHKDAEVVFQALCLYNHKDVRFWMGLGGCRQANGNLKGAIYGCLLVGLLESYATCFTTTYKDLASGSVTIEVKEAPDAISGATYSSKGLKRAVDTALTAFAQQKEVQ